MTLLLPAINDYEARYKFEDFVNSLYQAVADTGNLTYKDAGGCLKIRDTDVLSGTNTGEIASSQIPEELRDQVTMSSEISEMLD